MALTWLFLLGVLVGAAMPSAWAGDRALQRFWLEDPSGSLDLQQVQAAGFTPANEVVYQGFTRSTIWVRLDPPPEQANKPLLLSVVPTTLDEVRLYHPDGSEILVTNRLTGVAPLAPGQSLYLRVRSAGSMLVGAKLMTEAEMQDSEAARLLMLGVFLGCYAFTLAILVAMFASTRQAFHLICLLHLAVLGLTYLTGFGYLQDWLGPQWRFRPNLAGNVLIVLQGVMFTFLVRALLQLVGLPKWGDKVCRVLLRLYLAPLALLFMPDRQTAVWLACLITAAVSVVSIPIAAATFYRRRAGGWLILILLVLSMFHSLRVHLNLLGVTEPAEWVLNPLAVRAATTMLTFVMVLWILHTGQQAALRESMLAEAESRQRAAHEKSAREQKDRLMMMLLHEFRNPLAVIQLASASLKRRLEEKPEHVQRLDRIQRAVDELNLIVERCVQADRIELGQVALQRSRFSLEAMLKDLVASLEPARLRCSLRSDVQVECDPYYLRMIALNLLGNALKYSPPGSMVDVDLEHDGRELRLAVSNQAGRAGMPDMERLFSRYYRAEGARAHAGAGLGMWLSQMVAQQMGGRIECLAAKGHVQFTLHMAIA